MLLSRFGNLGRNLVGFRLPPIIATAEMLFQPAIEGNK